MVSLKLTAGKDGSLCVRTAIQLAVMGLLIGTQGAVACPKGDWDSKGGSLPKI